MGNFDFFFKKIDETIVDFGKFKTLPSEDEI
jgi:hypothetical protein